MNDTDKVSTICTECGAPVAFAVGVSHAQCAFCDAGMAIGEGTRLVRLDCPVCSGNFYYIDGLMGGQCPFCQSALLALTRDRVLRFVIPPEIHAPTSDASLVLVPFWQLTGVIFGWDVGSNIKIDHHQVSGQQDPNDPMSVLHRTDSGPQKVFRGRVIERWIPDPSTLTLGITSLRLRAAVFPMEPFRAEHESLGRMLPATLEIEGARDRLYEIAMSLGYATDGITSVECQRADLLAESLSLLYYPFWVRRRASEPDRTADDPGQASERAKEGYEIWDGVSGQPEPLSRPERSEVGPSTAVFDDLTVIELRCGQCSNVLPPGNHNVVYPCSHCATFWVADKDGLQPFSATYARPWTDLEAGDDPVWLPFWRVAVALDYCDRRAESVVDARDVLGVMRPPGEAPCAELDDALGYFVPAYGAMQAPKLDAAARDMTRLQPRLERGELSSGELFHCFYDPDDARKLAYVVWMQVLPVSLWRRLASLRIHPGPVHLWYIPFARRSRELVNRVTGARYDRMAFRGLEH